MSDQRQMQPSADPALPMSTGGHEALPQEPRDLRERIAALPRYTEAEVGRYPSTYEWVNADELSQVLEAQRPAAPSALPPVAVGELIRQLLKRAEIEDGGPDSEEAWEDVPEVTWHEMREIVALLRAAAQALALLSPADPAAPSALPIAEQREALSRGGSVPGVGHVDLPHRNTGDSSLMIKRGGPFSCECAGLGCSRLGCSYF